MMKMKNTKMAMLLEKARASNLACDWDIVEEYAAYLSKLPKQNRLEYLCTMNPSMQECLIYDI
jgi:hypothetical protein